MDQQHGRFVAGDEIDRLARLAGRFRENAFVALLGQRQEVVRAGKTDEAVERADRAAGRLQIAAIRRQKPGDLGAGRVAHQEEGMIAAWHAIDPAIHHALDLDDGFGRILDKGWKANLRIEPVIGDGDDESFTRQGLSDEEINVLRARIPASAMDEDEDGRRRSGSGWNIKIELGPLAFAIRNVAKNIVARAAGDGIERRRAGGQDKGRQHRRDETQEAGAAAESASPLIARLRGW